jgi:hypothetical protein
VWFKQFGKCIVHYHIPITAALAAGYLARVPVTYLAAAYFPLLIGLLAVERSRLLLRYFAFRASRAAPMRVLLYFVDRSVLLPAAALAGPWILASLVVTYSAVLLAHLLAVCLRLLLPAGLLIAAIVVLSNLNLAVLGGVLLLLGGGYLLFTVCVIAYQVLVAGGFFARLWLRVAGGFGGAGGVSASDFSGLLEQVGTASLLSAATGSAVDWHAADMPAADTGLVNFATGLQMLGDGSFMDVGGSTYGTDSYASYSPDDTFT